MRDQGSQRLRSVIRYQECGFLTYHYCQADIQPAVSGSANVDETIVEEPEAEDSEKVCPGHLRWAYQSDLFYLQA